MKIGRHFWIVVGGLFLICIGFIIFAYRFDWTGTGFEKKTLWDWLQLLVVPLALAIIAFLFNRTTTRTEQKIANQRILEDRQIAERRYQQDQKIAAQRYQQDQQIAQDKQREDLLQTYLDRMSELLLKEQLGSPTSKDEVRKVARVRTITILFQLDARRIGYVFAFLQDAGLMLNTSESIVSLSQANLSKINLSGADLSGADLSGANLSGANLSGANLSGANFSRANFSAADLSGANFIRANLSGANLSGANLSGANLSSLIPFEDYLIGAEGYEAFKANHTVNLSRANLSGVNLREVNLREVNLSGANLSGANLSRANLNGADLSGVYLIRADLSGADLSGAMMQHIIGLTESELETYESRGAII